MAGFASLNMASLNSNQMSGSMNNAAIHGSMNNSYLPVSSPGMLTSWSGPLGPMMWSDKGKTIAKITSLAGIGLTFEKAENGTGKPCVKDILPRGSAHREGSCEVGDILTHIDGETVVGLKLDQIREKILGVAGTKVRLTINKSNGRVLDVSLVRGSPEWWAFYDDNERLRRDLIASEKEVDALKKKLRDAEHVMARDRQEIENLHGQIASLERLNQKAQMDLDREVDLRRRSENMVNALTAEKKHLDDQIENLLKKVSEVTLSFKSAQGLAREMTEKARQSEQGRANEEKLRKLAEARETKSQSLLLEEIQRRKDAETELSTTQARMQALEAKLQHQADLMQQISDLNSANMKLQGELTFAQCEAADSKTHAATVRESCTMMQSRCNLLESQLAQVKQEEQDAKKAVELAEEVHTKLVAAKEEAMKKECDASKSSIASDANAQSLSNKCSSLEVAYTQLKHELSVAVKSAADAQAESHRDKLTAKDLADKLKAMTKRLDELQVAKDQEREHLSGELAIAEGRVEDQKQKTAALEKSNKKLCLDLTTKTQELNDKISQLMLEKKMLEDQTLQLESDLQRARNDEREVRMQILALEQTVQTSYNEKETCLSELRVLRGQLEVLAEEKAKIESDRKGLYLEIEALRAQMLKNQQERGALEQSVKDVTARCNELHQQILDVQTQLRLKIGEAENLSLRVADLENNLSGMPALKRENLAQKSKARDLEDLIAALKSENARVTEAELKCRSEITTCHKQIEELKGQITQQKMDFISEIGDMKRDLNEKYLEACNERDDLRVELDRYYSLPNIVGVGMGLEQTLESLPTGGTVKTTKVSGLAPGQSADLSGAIKIGDDLLEIDGIPCIGLTLDEIKDKVAGKRGTKVTLRMMRDFTEDGIQNGEIFTLCLKRGAWGPEHCVLEDKDMIDVGRWPKPGSISASNYDPSAVNRK